MKCQCCREEEASWSWQPFGPGENANTTFVLPGNHYRGFPVIKVGVVCKSAVETGDFPVQFTYKKFHYVYQDGRVSEIKPHLWDGGTSDLNGQGSATMIMKDTPDGSKLVAMVVDPALVPSFVVVPDLIEAAQRIEQAFPSYDGLSQDQALCLANVRVVLQMHREAQAVGSRRS
jgi:hypothetical protein